MDKTAIYNNGSVPGRAPVEGGGEHTGDGSTGVQMMAASRAALTGRLDLAIVCELEQLASLGRREGLHTMGGDMASRHGS